MARPFEGEYFNCIHCGEQFGRSKSNVRRGRTKYCSQTCSGAHKTGENNPSWRGGRHLNDRGYVRVWHDGGYVYEHRLALQDYLKRQLRSDEEVHHLDGNKQNNDINNLVILTKVGHATLHAALKPQRFCVACEEIHYCRGFCRLHYDRDRRQRIAGLR